MSLLTCLFALLAAGHDVGPALAAAGDNRAEIQAALDAAPADMRDGMEFLVANMPEQDLRTLDAAFLLHHCTAAHRAWREAPWHDQVPEEVFRDAILPYASVSERRDPWRDGMREVAAPMIAGVDTPGLAAARINQKLFGAVGVRYSTQRPKADQSPAESIAAGTASCTGLSILLIDACRSVGVPARFVGTPRWSDDSGNHSWVEVWSDGGWHFTGAAEAAGDRLDDAWFTGRAATARRDEPRYAIYAVTWRATPVLFPMVWSRQGPRVHAVNVTDRYTAGAAPVPEGFHLLRLRVVGPDGERRVQAALTVQSAAGKPVFTGTSKDEGFDANDHVSLTLAEGSRVEVAATGDAGRATASVVMGAADQLVTLRLAPAPAPTPAPAPLSRAEAEALAAELWQEHVARIREERAAEMAEKTLRLGDLVMRFDYTIFGDAPANGRSLFLSMHGGGGAPPRVNDQQWENQKHLYEPAEGVYLAPRAPTDTWNLWHQAHIDAFFDRLIEDLVVFEDVDPDRVYLMGYSAGGDGVYQLAPRMADRFAAAAMMAGHPNEARPLGLRDLPFTLHMGGDDAAYHRNEVAAQWQARLAELHAADPGGYVNEVVIHPGKGHWMDREDAVAVPWMAQYTRDPCPDRVVWYQDDVTHDRFYWLAVPEGEAQAGARVTATRDGQTVTVAAEGLAHLTLRFRDGMVDLDRPVVVRTGERVLFEGLLERSAEVLRKTLAERGDRRSVYAAEVTVALGEGS